MMATILAIDEARQDEWWPAAGRTFFYTYLVVITKGIAAHSADSEPS
jgi:hypothetical protein